MSNRHSKTQRYPVYCQIKQRQTGNPSNQEAETRESWHLCLINLLLKNCRSISFWLTAAVSTEKEQIKITLLKLGTKPQAIVAEFQSELILTV